MEAGTQDPKPDDGRQKPAEERSDTWLHLLQRVGRVVAPAVLTVGGFVGFLAFAGSVIVWTRFEAAQVPPDQAVAAYPRGELVAVASALLLIFGFVGVLAVLSFFLINRKGEATIGVFRGLLGLLAVEGLTAIALVDTHSDTSRILAAELFLLPLFVAFWATFVTERPGLSEDGGDEDDGTWAAWLPDALDPIQDYFSRRGFVNRTALIVTVIAILSLIALAAGLPLKSVLIAALGLICAVPTGWLIWKLTDNPRRRQKPLPPGTIPFERRGQLLILILLPFAAIGPLVLLHSGWLPFSLFAAVCLVAALWRVAIITEKFVWYGVAVFISVPLFGTITGTVRNVAEPQVQPVALIREEDGPDEAIQGIYVSETDDRVYFATVATQGCTDQLVPHSGRLLWVPRSDVVAMSVGPPQSVDDAARTALEMSYALTPVVETPAGDNVSLTVAEKRGEEHEEAAVPQTRRLEDVGPAVQPNFGRGLRLSPENASPGDVVTLKMAAPNAEVGGFGPSRQGRTLRLGGVPVDIVKEEALDPREGEYVETEDGRALNLAKETLYRKDGDAYVALDGEPDPANEDLFVRLTDESVIAVDDKGLAEDNYLLLETSGHEPPQIASRGGTLPEVTMDDGTDQVLETRLLRQAWHETNISFQVPDHATTGAVTVECNQLAGQPLLRVARPPQPSISVQMMAGSRKVIFDSRRSTDNSRIVSRQWWVEGIDQGKDARISENLPPRVQGYTVKLKVTDAEGQAETAELHLLRLPAHLVSFAEKRWRYPGVLAQAKAELQRATASRPAAIEFDMRPGELPEAPNPNRTIEQAERARRFLLAPDDARSVPLTTEAERLTIKTLAFGASCPAERESEVGRLDVIVLGEGVRVVPPDECPVVRLSTARKLLSPP